MSIEQLYELFLRSTGVCTDSRQIQPGNMFFALKGENFNGNLFAREALEKGASSAIVDEALPHGEYPLIRVQNVLNTLQQLAFFHRNKFGGRVIAISGSNGKTTTKELIAAVLSTQFVTYATVGNLNNHIGIPLTLLSMPVSLDFAIIEMGANHQKEIESYCRYVEPDFGLITNVGWAHIEGFGGFEGVVKGKTELYRFLASRNGKLFIHADNQILFEKAKEAGFRPEDLITYGTQPHVFCRGKILEGEFVSLHTMGLTIRTNLVGSYNFENVLAACCVGKYFGIFPEHIQQAVENYEPQNQRSQRIEIYGNTVILDCYNANPTSMKAALKSFAASAGNPKIAILGGMKELGKESPQLHREIAELAKTLPLEQVIFIGNEFEVADFGKKFSSTEQAQLWLEKNFPKNAHIFVKGSRSYRLEKLFRF
jgi:UDP-N-acetylmuramoyl-tripeptide--D-alanyl-D-alanine ligase